jgi:cell division protein FtsQ
MRKLRKSIWNLLGPSRRTTTRVATPPKSSRRRRRSSQKTLGDRVKSTTKPALRNALRFVPYALIAIAAASLPLFGYELYVDLMTSPHLALKTVTVEGCQRLDAELVRRSASVTLGDNLLQVDEDEVVERLRWHPWVRKVQVTKELPDTLRIQLEERVPAAILVEERSFLVDEGGYLFKEMEPGEFDAGLLVIAGIKATEMVKAGEEKRLRRTLSEIIAVAKEYRTLGYERYYQILEAHYDDVVGLTLVGQGRQRFVLGNGAYPAKLRRLGEILGHLAKNESGVESVRLDNERHPWKVAVAGSTITFEAERKGALVPEVNMEMLP